MTIYLTFSRIRHDYKFMTHVSPNWPRLRFHWNCLQPHLREGTQIGHKHLVIRVGKDVSHVDVEAAGHVVMVDQPDSFVEAVRGFLSL